MKNRIALSALMVLCLLAPISPACGIGTSPSYAGEGPEDQPRPDQGVIVQKDDGDTGVIVQRVAPDIEKDPGGFAGEVLAAAKNGEWRLLSGLVLIALVWATRRWGSKLVPWFSTDRGGAALVLGLALLGGVATTLFEGAPLSMGLLANVVSMAMTAAGGWAIVKKLLSPSDKAAG